MQPLQSEGFELLLWGMTFSILLMGMNQQLPQLEMAFSLILNGHESAFFEAFQYCLMGMSPDRRTMSWPVARISS